MEKSRDAFRTISEVAEWLGTPTHVLRFWESRFSQLKPVKRAGGRRYYRPGDMELLGGIKKLLHDDGMTIRGVQKLLREEGPRHVAAFSPALGDTTQGIVIEATPTPIPDEAPIELDVVQAPPENIVQFDETQQQDQPQDIPDAPLPEQPVADQPVADKTVADQPAADQPAIDPPVTAPQPAPDTPKPIVADVPDDPEDDENAGTIDIVNVALSLRKFADAQSGDKTKTGTFSTIYGRLTQLRSRMDDPSSRDSSD